MKGRELTAGEMLGDLIHRAGVTQVRIADLTGLNHATISVYATDKALYRNNPSRRTVLAIAQSLIDLGLPRRDVYAWIHHTGYAFPGGLEAYLEGPPVERPDPTLRRALLAALNHPDRGHGLAVLREALLLAREPAGVV